MVSIIPLVDVLLFYSSEYFLILHLKFHSTSDENIEVKNFSGFEYAHKTGTITELKIIERSTNSHYVLSGSTGSDKTYFLKYYFKKNTIDNFIVIGRNPTEWNPDIYKNVLNFANVNLHNITSKTITLDDGAYKEMKKNFFNN